MDYISLFSGIGGFDEAFRRAGMECDAVCEIDKAAQGILTRHFPEARLFDDVRKVGKETHERKSIDLICGGFPCQDVSIAGKRAGITGERSGLWFEFARIIDELEPQWVVVENVPGLLSSNKGKDFAVIVQWLAQRGYGVTWRVLDAQYFGVPQRRRRVFIVGSFGNGSSAEVLFEREGGAGNNPPGRETGKDIAYSLRRNPSHSGKGNGGINTTMVAQTLTGGGKGHKGRQDPVNTTLVADTLTSMYARNRGAAAGNSSKTHNLFVMAHGEIVNDGSPSLTNNHEAPILWHNHQQDGSVRIQDDGTAPTVSRQWGTGNVPMVGVRRLTPVECERLQGFPDGWTDGQSDSARYRQLGNAVAVPVVEWIGKRIMSAHNSV